MTSEVVRVTKPSIQPSNGIRQGKVIVVSLKTRLIYRATNVIGIPHSAKLVLKEITGFFSETNPFQCYLSISSLCQRVGLKKCRMYRIIKKLVDENLIIRINQYLPNDRGLLPQVSNAYALTPYAISLMLNEDDPTESLALTREIQALSKGRTFLTDHRQQVTGSLREEGEITPGEHESYLARFEYPKKNTPPPGVLLYTQITNPDSSLTQRNQKKQNTHPNGVTYPDKLGKVFFEDILKPNEDRKNQARALLREYRRAGFSQPRKESRRKFIDDYAKGDWQYEELVGYLKEMAKCRLLKYTTKGPSRLFTMKKYGLPMRDMIRRMAREYFNSILDITEAADRLLMDDRINAWFGAQDRPGRFRLLGDFDKSMAILIEEVKDCVLKQAE